MTAPVMTAPAMTAPSGTPFDAGRTLRFATQIARPRLCGSDEERRVAQEIRAALEEAGLDVEEQFFHARPLGDAWVRLSLAGTHAALALAACGLFVDARLTWAGLGAFALMVAAGPLGARALSRLSVRDVPSDAPVARRWRKSANVVGRTRVPLDGGGGPLLVFVAHYDSKSQSLSLGARARQAMLARKRGFSFVGLIGAGLVGVAFPPWFVAAAWLLVVGLSLPLYALRTHNRSPGANDNASGVGVLVELARIWPTLPASARCRAIFLTPSGEELGLLGSDIWVRRHLEALRREPALFVLNLDTVGAPAPVWVVPARGPRGDNLSMPRALVETGKSAGVQVRPYAGRVGLVTDHLSFTRRGIDCATLLAHEWTDETLHTPDDSVDALREEGFVQIGRVVLAAIERLAASEAKQR